MCLRRGLQSPFPGIIQILVLFLFLLLLLLLFLLLLSVSSTFSLISVVIVQVGKQCLGETELK